MATKKTETRIVRAELVNVRPAERVEEPSHVDAAVDRVADKVKRVGRKGERSLSAARDFFESVFDEFLDDLDDDGRGPPPHVTHDKGR